MDASDGDTGPAADGQARSPKYQAGTFAREKAPTPRMSSRSPTNSRDATCRSSTREPTWPCWASTGPPRSRESTTPTHSTSYCSSRPRTYVTSTRESNSEPPSTKHQDRRIRTSCPLRRDAMPGLSSSIGSVDLLEDGRSMPPGEFADLVVRWLTEKDGSLLATRPARVGSIRLGAPALHHHRFGGRELSRYREARDRIQENPCWPGGREPLDCSSSGHTRIKDLGGPSGTTRRRLQPRDGRMDRGLRCRCLLLGRHPRPDGPADRRGGSRALRRHPLRAGGDAAARDACCHASRCHCRQPRGPLNQGAPLDRPFNLADLSLGSHTPIGVPAGDDPRVARLSERIQIGFKQYHRHPHYHDLPVYDCIAPTRVGTRRVGTYSHHREEARRLASGAIRKCSGRPPFSIEC